MKMKMFKATSIVGLVLLAALVCSTQVTVPVPEEEASYSAFLKQLTKKYLELARLDDWTEAAYAVDVLDYTREQIFVDAEDSNVAEDKAFQISVFQTAKLQEITAKFESYVAELKRDIQAIQNLLYKKKLG